MKRTIAIKLNVSSEENQDFLELQDVFGNVNPAYTSVTCSCCLSYGHRIKHHFFCFSCGSHQHSDLNASQNLLRL